MEVTTDDLCVHDRLKGQLAEVEDRIAIYHNLLKSNEDTRARWAIIDAIESMRDHHARIEDALDDIVYS